MKIISFAPHTAVWSFALPEATLAVALQKKGHEVTYVTAGTQFIDCSICLSSYNLKYSSRPIDKETVKRLGVLNEEIIRKEFNLLGYAINTVLTEQDLDEIAMIVKKVNQDNFTELVIDGTSVGKSALYEFLLHHKKMSLEFSESEWQEYLISLTNTLFSFFSARKIIAIEKPDIIIVYNALYSVNHVWQEYARAKGVPVYFIHAGLNLSDLDDTLIVSKDNSFAYFNELKDQWKSFKHIPCTQDELSYVTDHFLELLEARHHLVYSTAKSALPVDIRSSFKISKTQKILTAVMSSYDERFAAEAIGVKKEPSNLIFASQVAWIMSLVEYLRTRPDLFLIIRVHPREFPSKKNATISEHARMLEKIFKDLPSNCRVNWPAEKISLYNIAQETDVFLNAWSSVGVEMSLLGIPVVIYSKDLINYTPDINYVAESHDDYFRKIEQALHEGWSFEKVRQAYRWYNLFFNRSVFRWRVRGKRGSKLAALPILPKIKRAIYDFLPQQLKFWIKMRLLLGGKKQTEECQEQVAQHLDINQVESMLQESRNSLLPLISPQVQVTESQESLGIHEEIIRLYNALYIEKTLENEFQNNLQSHLKAVIYENVSP